MNLKNDSKNLMYNYINRIITLMQYSEYYQNSLPSKGESEMKKKKITSGITTSVVTGDRLRYINQNSLNGFRGTLFSNFQELAKFPDLKHNPEELGRLLTSKNFVMFS